MIAVIIAGIALLLFVIEEWIDFEVYGSFLKEEKYDSLLKKLNTECFSSKGIIHFGYYDFASRKSGILSRWYIHKNGNQKRIFIFSKMNKLLNEKYKQLRKADLSKEPLFQ